MRKVTHINIYGTTMKKLTGLMMIVAMVCITACNGSGGGGSSSGIKVADSAADPILINSAPSTDPAYTELEDVSMFSYMVADGEYIVPASTDGYVKKTPTGIEATLNYDIDGEKFIRLLEFDDFKDDGKDNGYYLSSLESTKDFNNSNSGNVNIDGTVTMVDTIYIGGKKLGLSYSEFGGWAASTNIKGTGSYLGIPLPINTTTQDMEGMWLGNDSAKKSFDGVAAAQDFTGNAIAVAYENNENSLDAKSALVTGSATISVNPANLAATTLKLDFTDFYSFTLSNIEVLSSGAIAATDSSAISVVEDMANSSGINFGADLNVDVLNGQFYGKDLPTEAVGAFRIGDKSEAGIERGISGSFGVKEAVAP